MNMRREKVGFITIAFLMVITVLVTVIVNNVYTVSLNILLAQQRYQTLERSARIGSLLSYAVIIGRENFQTIVDFGSSVHAHMPAWDTYAGVIEWQPQGGTLVITVQLYDQHQIVATRSTLLLHE